jgi:hypothetical protein
MNSVGITQRLQQTAGTGPGLNYRLTGSAYSPAGGQLCMQPSLSAEKCRPRHVTEMMRAKKKNSLQEETYIARLKVWDGLCLGVGFVALLMGVRYKVALGCISGIQSG